MRIIFMGTPEPAAKCLQALIDAQEQVVCVVTQPDRKKGRGLIPSPSPVKLLAEKYKIPAETPEIVKDRIFINKIKSYNPDLIVVVAYGKILPKEIIDLPKFGAINVHASLLPKLRGAAPVQWAILKGEASTGVTIMRINETLDTGDIITQKEVEIKNDDDAETLMEKLFGAGAELLLKAISEIKNNTAKRIPQKKSDATYAPLITKELGEIDWKKSAAEIVNQVRALVPWPCAHTFYGKKTFKILKAEIFDLKEKALPGEIFLENEKVFVACGEGALLLDIVQYEGGRKMEAPAFFRGHNRPFKKILPN